jgi:hypothetical protein
VEGQPQLSKVLAGAAIGATFAFLFLTPRGQRLLNDAEPWLEGLIRDLQRLNNAAGKAREAMDEGRRSFAAMSNAVPFGHHKDRDWSNESHH